MLTKHVHVTVQFQKYPPYRDTLVLFRFLLCDHHTLHTARIIVQHRLERQETSQDPVPAGLAIQLKLYVTLCLKWSSVLELCCVTLQIRTQALPLQARIYH